MDRDIDIHSQKILGITRETAGNGHSLLGFPCNSYRNEVEPTQRSVGRIKLDPTRAGQINL